MSRTQNRFGDRLLMALVFLFLYAPIIILIVFSFNAGTSSSVWKGFSLKWYESLLSNRLIMNSVYTTLLVSLLSTIVASIAGTFAAIGLYAMSRRRRAAVNAVNNIPMMNADIVTGVSLCLLFVVFFNGWGAFAGWMNSWQSLVVLPERLTMGFGTLLIAHICFNIPYVILSVGPKLRQMDRNLIDAAQDLGCTWMQAFWRVVIPEIKPGIVSGALTAFTMSVDDFIISYFTAGTSSSTLAMTIYGMTKKRVSPEINAISTLLFVTVLVLLAVVNLRESRADHRLKAEHHAAPSAAHHPNRSKLHKTLRRVGAGLAACVLVVTLIVTGRSARSDRVVNVCSWGEYIDESLITQFEEETGIRVNYQTAESNEALYSLIKMGGADFDVIVPSDYMIARLIDEDMLAELDYSHIPNFDLIADTYKNLSYDPENKYSVPYMWGTVGILYNKDMIPEPNQSWSILWDTQYQKNVFMLDSYRDSMGITLKYLGYSMNSREVPELMAAKDKLIEQKQSGVVKAYQVDETKDKMVAGEAALALMWSGDAQYAIDLNDHLDYFVPSEGSNIWVDGAVILKSARNKENAEKFINFLCRPDIAQMNCEYIWYSSPNKGAIELMGEEYENNHVLNPSQEVRDRCEFFHDIDDTFRKIYENLWMEIKNTK